MSFRRPARVMANLRHAFAHLQPFWLPALCIGLVHATLSLARNELPTIPVEDVRPGMKGFGLTVFRGTTPERFPVEVIDVLHQFRPGQDLILIRTPHPLLEEAKAVAGMSGSPIYLDGKLAGAYAYGWPFATEPVVGVTPIAAMLAELARPIDPAIWDILGPAPQPAPRKLARTRTRASIPVSNAKGTLPPYRDFQPHDALWAIRRVAQRSTAPGAPQPAQTPLMLAGFSNHVTAMLSRELEPLGLVAVQAGASSGPAPRKAGQGQPRGYQNGSAIGVQLISGDVSATAVGTVTHVDGQRLVAFGHPMMNVGQTAMPTSTTEVVHILSSQQRSFKMSRPLQPQGTLIQDRQAAVVVDTELEPERIPVTLRLTGSALPSQTAADGSGTVENTTDLRTTWRFQVASNRALTPMLVYSALVNALKAATSDAADVVFRARSEITVAGRTPIVFVDEGHLAEGISSPALPAKLRVFSALDAIYGNPFERSRLTGLAMDVHLSYSDAVAEIISAQVPFTHIEPGQEVPVHITLRTFDGQERREVMRIRVPYSAAGETIQLQLQPGHQIRPPQPIPTDLDSLLAGLQARYQATSLVATVQLPTKGIRLPGHVAHRLPGSFVNALQTSSQTAPSSLFSDVEFTELPLGQVLYGSTHVQLHILDEARR